jgi:hypothetical protein
MGWLSALSDRIKAMMGFTVYQETGPGPGLAIDDPSIEMTRRAVGGEIQPIPVTQTRWYLRDLEQASAEADSGNFSRIGQLYRSCRRDGVLRGLIATRTDGIVRLPKRFYGSNPAIIERLRAKNGSRSVFDEMCPPGQLGALASDGLHLGFGLAELVPVVGRSYPVLHRLDPQWLQFNWGDCRWYYNSRAGRIPVNGGDGRFVLHLPYGPLHPWQWGLIWAVGRAFINKEHAEMTRAGFIAGVANPAKILQSPTGASEQHRRGIFEHLINWGPNTALELPVGFEGKLLEVTGQAWQTYQQEVNTCDNEMMVALAGQVVTTTGGTGFANADVHRLIRADLIKSTAEDLAYTINTQILPLYVEHEFGSEALEAGTMMEWDISTPKDLEAETKVLNGLATGVMALRQVYGDRLDVDEYASRFGIPLRVLTAGTPQEVGATPIPELASVPAPQLGPASTDEGASMRELDAAAQ